MIIYSSSQEITNKIRQNSQKLVAEFDTIPEALKDTLIIEVDRTPSEILSYQLGWVNLLLQWEQDEQNGLDVQTPSSDYKCNNLGGLYQSFYETYGHSSLLEQKDELEIAVNKLCNWVETMPTKDLFESGQRKWATTNAMWPVWKWVHINTVAPFKSFRAIIRKWKKHAL